MGLAEGIIDDTLCLVHYCFQIGISLFAYYLIFCKDVRLDEKLALQ